MKLYITTLLLLLPFITHSVGPSKLTIDNSQGKHQITIHPKPNVLVINPGTQQEIDLTEKNNQSQYFYVAKGALRYLIKINELNEHTTLNTATMREEKTAGCLHIERILLPKNTLQSNGTTDNVQFVGQLLKAKL